MTLNQEPKTKEQNTQVVECHIKIAENSTHSLISLLEQELNAQGLPLSKALIKQAIAKGALWLTKGKHTQRLRRIKKALQPGNELHFYYNAKVLAFEVSPAQLIADMTDYSVWYKPYGMLSQGSKWSDHCTIARFAQQNLTPARPVFIVHRLDRAATGIILVAHSKNAARALSKMFEQHQLTKEYQIIVHGDFSQLPQPQVITTKVDDKSALSTFTHKAFDKEKEQSLVAVKIDTGRKHQIRKHAASIDFPVVGDRLHGLTNINEEKLDLQLCAVHLAFICPLTGQERDFTLADNLKPRL